MHTNLTCGVPQSILDNTLKESLRIAISDYENYLQAIIGLNLEQMILSYDYSNASPVKLIQLSKLAEDKNHWA